MTRAVRELLAETLCLNMAAGGVVDHRGRLRVTLKGQPGLIKCSEATGCNGR
jgi:hypothetical protein